MERIKTTMEKYEIINLKIQGWSNSKISNTFRVSRNTIRKYWDEYQSKLKLAIENNPRINTRTLIEEIVSKPHYDTSNRACRKYSEEIDTLLETILKWIDLDDVQQLVIIIYMVIVVIFNSLLDIKKHQWNIGDFDTLS